MKVRNGLITELNTQDQEHLVIPADAIGFAEDCANADPGTVGGLPSIFGGLLSVKVEKGNPAFRVVNKCLMHNDGTLYAAARGAKLPADGSVKCIHCCAFNMHAMRGELRIPEGVESIRELAFGSNAFSAIRIPASVKHIAGGAFWRPLVARKNAKRNHWTIEVDAGNEFFYTQGGCLIDRRTMAVVASFGSEVIVPEGVKRVEQDVFLLSHFDKIVLPASVEHIDTTNFVGMFDSKIYVAEDSYAEEFLKSCGYAHTSRTYSYL